MRLAFGRNLVAILKLMIWKGKGVVVTYQLIFKTAYTLAELDTLASNYLAVHGGRIGVLGSATSIKFSESSLFGYYGTLTIPNRPYSPELADTTTSLYEDMRHEFYIKIKEVYCNDIEDISKITFNKGSVIVNFLLVLKRHHTTAEVTDILHTYLRDHNNVLGLFIVDPKSVKFSDRVSFVYYGKIVMPNRPYKSTFSDKTSAIYKEMSRHVDETMRVVFGQDVVSVTETKFSKGSVIVTFKVEMKRFYSLNELITTLKKSVKDHKNRFGLFYVNPEKITFADIDMYQAGPCKNDGTCLNLVDVYRCDCVGNFIGTNCESVPVQPAQNRTAMFVGIGLSLVVLLVVCLVVGYIVKRRGEQQSPQNGATDMTVANEGDPDLYETLDKHKRGSQIEPISQNIDDNANSDRRNTMEYDNYISQELSAQQSPETGQVDTELTTPYLTQIQVGRPTQ